MNILAILQNQWMTNAAFHQKRSDELKSTDLEKWWRVRERQIPFALFRGCKSGRILFDAFGAELCEKIVWEEASTTIGKRPSDCPPFDARHILACLHRYRPEFVLTFGHVARQGLIATGTEYPGYSLPHPCAREPGVYESFLATGKILCDRML